MNISFRKSVVIEKCEIATQTDNEIMLSYIVKFLAMLEDLLRKGNINLEQVKKPAQHHLQT